MDKEKILDALQQLVDRGGTIHWRGLVSPIGCEQELFRLGFAKRDPIVVPGMDQKGATITEQGLAFLKAEGEPVNCASADPAES